MLAFPWVHNGPSGCCRDCKPSFHLHNAGKSVVFFWVSGLTRLPTSEIADAATDWAVGSDVCAAFIHTSVIPGNTWSHAQVCRLQQIVHTHWHMGICCVVNQYQFVQTGGYPLLFYIFWWNAHVMMETITCFRFMVLYVKSLEIIVVCLMWHSFMRWLARYM